MPIETIGHDDDMLIVSRPRLDLVISQPEPRASTDANSNNVVGPAVFLASDLAAYVTGTIIMANGGYRTV